jgi:proteasome lid subunit RPN8/RPN11
MAAIIIRARHLQEVIDHCREAFPKEACGILAGSGEAVEMVIRLRNADDSPVTYSLDPAEQNRALRFIESEGLRVVAIYHSHTASAAYPSPTDVERAFFPGTREPNFPDSAYVIVSLAAEEPSVKAFVITEDAIEDAEITVL